MQVKCPQCGSTDIDVYTKDNPDMEFLFCFVCQNDSPYNYKGNDKKEDTKPVDK